MFQEKKFICNLCGTENLFQEQHSISAETPSCTSCASNIRFRWLVHRLSLELFGRSISLNEFPHDSSISGIGLTDPHTIASVLQQKLNYLNTFLTSEPKLDIRNGKSPIGPLDFLIASEVFEHVEPPVEEAFQNVASLLKPDGFLLLTVPWVWDGNQHQALPELHDWRLGREDNRWLVLNRRPDGSIEKFFDMVWDDRPGPCLGKTREHFPHLHHWKLIQTGDQWHLENQRQDGTAEQFHELVFHEGPGLALELRLFTKRSLEKSLKESGFSSVEFATEDYPPAGIFFPDPWSRPVLARLKPAD